MNAWTTWILLEGPGVARVAASGAPPVASGPARAGGTALEACLPIPGTDRMAAPDAPSRPVPWIGPSAPRRGTRVHPDEETA